MLIYQLVIILIASKLAGHISVRLGQPSVLGKLLIGIVLGPAVLGFIHETEVLKEISKIGVILLMFIAGLETDVAEFKRTGKSAAYVGFSGIIVPFGLGYLTGTVLDMKATEAIFLGLLLSATSVSISVQALKEMGKLKSSEGSTILGAAVIDDVVVVIALAFVMSFTGGDVNLGLVLVKKGVFFAVALLFSWLVVPWFLRKFSTLRVTETVISAGLVLCFSYAYFAEYTGVADIIGAYIAGVAISTTEFKHQVFDKMESISYSIFVPVFFTSIGVAVEFHGLTGSSYVLILVLSVIAIVSKLVGAAIGAKLSGFRLRPALGIGAAMVSRGEVALIIASIGLEEALITKSLFAVIVVVVLVTTIVTPPMMKAFFKTSES